ncbi:MAG: hypothetical protein A2081_00505 [Elusimicrobia bacterium GWC2_61_19]|nr:MAG: hypothetical protein A2081_00505 [Elusimicrobia bacterium GWC2_61_19]
MNIFAISKLLLTSAFLAAPAAAQNFNSLPSVKDIVAQARASQVPVPQPALRDNSRAPKEWTIMVFMNGKNDLAPYVIEDMNEMEKYGPTGNINIVAQAARMAEEQNPHYPPPSNGPYDGYPYGPVVPHPGWPNPAWDMPPMLAKTAAAGDASTNWIGVRRYLVTADGDNAALSSTMLADLGAVDMGDYKQLAEFGKWAKQNYPAKRYMLIVWNHGDGWKNKAFGRPVLKGISYDDETGHGISTVDLGRAVREMGGVDIYASDACLMQMAEVAYELKDAARITVGSEENEPGDGWAYDYFLARVHSNKGNLTPDVMAAAAVQGYKAFYGEKGANATQSAVHTAGLNTFRTLLDQWAGLAMKEDKVMVNAALADATAFGGAESRDLIHFLRNVHGKTKSDALKAKTAEVMDHLYKKVIFDNGATGDKFKNAYGLAVYLPTYRYEADYDELAWAGEGRWDDFAKWLTAK